MSGEYDKQASVPDTEPLAIEHFAQAARALEAEAFLARYGDRFLIHQGPLEPERRVKRPMRTAIMLSGGPLLDPGTPGPPPGADLLVFPLRQPGGAPSSR